MSGRIRNAIPAFTVLHHSMKLNFHSGKVPYTVPMGAIISCRKSYSVNTSKTDLNVDAGSRTMSPPETDPDAAIQSVLCKEDDIPDEGMKEFEVDGSKILLVKSQGQLSAIGAKCTHYGAPLVKGALCQGRVRCPFHGACFNIKTGDIEDFPGLDSVPSFPVEVLPNGDVTVTARKSHLTSVKRVRGMAKRDPSVNESYVIVGGGAAGGKCSETLRQEGFTGRIILISAECTLPYDRPKLSKMMHQKAENIALRSSGFYEECDIEMKLGSPVTHFDAEGKNLTLSNGDIVHFDKCLFATGGRARSLDLPGSDLEGVFVLRTPNDANSIVDAAKEKNVIIVGSSFIGMEAAAYLAADNRCSSVTVIGSSSVPFERSLGKRIGERLMSWFEEKGVRFFNGTSIVEIVGLEGAVSKVLLKNGEEIPGELVLAGIGVVPSTEFLKDTGLNLSERGHVTVNKRMETNISGVYTGGDIASFPLHIANEDNVAIGHWQMAHKHGHVAALNMLGRETDIDSIPFFWTALFGKSIRYAGYGSYDDVLLEGDLDGLAFIAYYCKGDEVIAVASCGKDPAVAKYANYRQSGKKLTREEVIQDGQIALKLIC